MALFLAPSFSLLCAQCLLVQSSVQPFPFVTKLHSFFCVCPLQLPSFHVSQQYPLTNCFDLWSSCFCCPILDILHVINMWIFRNHNFDLSSGLSSDLPHKGHSPLPSLLFSLQLTSRGLFLQPHYCDHRQWAPSCSWATWASPT